MTPQQQKFMELSLETSKNTLTALKLANEQGAIADTIWLSKYETLFDYIESQIDAMQRILAQPKEPEQEPVACVTYKEVADTMNGLWGGTLVQRQIAEELENTMLYTTPPQRKPLTDEEIRKANHHMVDGAYDYSFKQGVKWAEYKHGIKGEA